MVNFMKLCKANHDWEIISIPTQLSMLIDFDVLNNFTQNQISLLQRVNFENLQENVQNVNRFITFCACRFKFKELDETLNALLFILIHLS